MQVEDTKSRTADLLYELYFNVKAHNVTRATALKEQLHDMFENDLIDDENLGPYYVANLGYVLMDINFDVAEKLLGKIDQIKHELDDQWSYRYHLFKGLYDIIGTSDFDEAKSNFEVAKDRLDSIDDEIERAEYDYKMAFMYYHLEDTLHSVQYITKALEVFRKTPEYRSKCVACEMILGLNSIDMKQYEQAEEQFYKVLDFSNDVNDEKLKKDALHNLGLLYAKQNKSAAAVLWLEKSLQSGELHYLSVYLLSQENFKLGNNDKAIEWMQKGIKLCQNYNNLEYVMRFKLLEAFYIHKGTEYFVDVYKEGISYFCKEKLWRYVDEYAEQLADFYRKQKNYENAAHYYSLASDARNKLFESEGLN